MQKICISFIILLLIFSTQVFALEEWGERNKKINDAISSTLKEYMEPYKSENVPENERIISYDYRGGSYDYSRESEGIFKASINYAVKPYVEENTIWRLEENYLFIEYSIVDGEYIAKNISATPENYDKFLKRFEEYKKNGNESIEIDAIQVEKTEELKSSQIQKMSNIIFIISGITLVVVIAIIIKFKVNCKIKA